MRRTSRRLRSTPLWPRTRSDSIDLHRLRRQGVYPTVASISRMTAHANRLETPPEEIVRGFLDALRSGRVLDALDVFALDGTIRDAKGHEHRGIREIVQFVNQGGSDPLQIEEIRRDRDTVTAIVRSAAGGREDRLRHTY